MANLKNPGTRLDALLIMVYKYIVGSKGTNAKQGSRIMLVTIFISVACAAILAETVYSKLETARVAKRYQRKANYRARRAGAAAAREALGYTFGR